MMEEKLPKGWRIITLGKAISLEYGKGLPKKDRSGAGYPVMGSNGIIDEHFEYLIEGPGIIVGRKGSHGEVVWVDKNFFPIDTTYFVIPKPIVELRFAYYFLKKSDLKSLNRSTAIPGLNRTDAYNLELPLPPLPEQQRIVAKLDALFGHLDSLREKLDRIPELLKNFRQQVLTQAVTGELTKEWREGKRLQNIQDLVDEILKTKEQLIKSKKIRKEKRLTEITEEQKLMNIPNEWDYIKIGKLSSFINGDRGKNYPNRSEYVSEDGVAFINTGHIEPNGSLDVTSMNYISKQKYDSLSGGKIMSGDLVYCLRGATLGKTAVVTQFNKGAIASSLVIIRPIKGLNNWYLYYFLTSPIGKKYIRQYDNGSAQPNLSAENVRNYVIGLPSLEEQQEIVNRVEVLFSLADKIESQYASLKTKIDQLPKAILTKAFRGELVAQEVKEYVVEEIEGLMVAEDKERYRLDDKTIKS